ncbi:hypothetical protein Fmac_004535 [Flemingia macrophylla]|uniref:Uncharacterized protein n=1 Tax=Flemingia macrophylla TaxID=520843 RepID=A0ABD1N7U3_9FABA
MIDVGTTSGADFDAKVSAIRSSIVNELEETALFIATEKGHLHVVNDIPNYASNEGVSFKNDLGFDPLHVAANRGHLHIVQLLLDRDRGLIKTCSLSNATPLISAAIRGHTSNALHLAASQGHAGVVKLLLARDPQLAKRTDKRRQTALHMAVMGVSCETVKLILHTDAAIVMLPDVWQHCNTYSFNFITYDLAIPN